MLPPVVRSEKFHHGRDLWVVVRHVNVKAKESERIRRSCRSRNECTKKLMYPFADIFGNPVAPPWDTYSLDLYKTSALRSLGINQSRRFSSDCLSPRTRKVKCCRVLSCFHFLLRLTRIDFARRLLQKQQKQVVFTWSTRHGMGHIFGGATALTAAVRRRVSHAGVVDQAHQSK